MYVWMDGWMYIYLRVCMCMYMYMYIFLQDSAGTKNAAAAKNEPAFAYACMYAQAYVDMPVFMYCSYTASS